MIGLTSSGDTVSTSGPKSTTKWIRARKITALNAGRCAISRVRAVQPCVVRSPTADAAMRGWTGTMVVLAKFYSRVEIAIQHVDEQIRDDDDDCEQHRHAHDHRVVPTKRRIHR